MIRKPLILKLFDAASIQRWNDKIRPMDFTELDKQAHKMVIAYFLGKFEENNSGFDWLSIIEGGIFELLQRIVVTDIKPPIFYRIKEDKQKYCELNKWIYNQIEPAIEPLGKEFCNKFLTHFNSDDEDINKRILNAAHFYATKWEFDIIKRANPIHIFEIDVIETDIISKQKKYSDLQGIRLLQESESYRKFIDLCGQLRFQARWAHLHRVPKTSVMGHLLIVAILTYLCSIENKACPKRCINNFFTGLFHDLPEVLTRDIISPIKRSVEQLDKLIKEYEAEKMKKEVYSLLPRHWHSDIRIYTEDEFSNIVLTEKGVINVETIDSKHNKDEFMPRDGSLVKAVDELASFIEAYLAIQNGSASQLLQKAVIDLKEKYENERPVIAGIDFRQIYSDF